MRLFVAFRVPSAPLLALQEKLIFEGVKLTHDYHCTLKFLGEVSDEKVHDILKRLRKISFSPFHAHFSDVCVFPNLSNPRVVWAGLKPEKDILALQQQIDDTLKDLFPREERFVPHVTLARMKYLKNRDSFTRIIGQTKVEQKEFAVNELILFKSELKETGPVHTVIDTFSSNDLENI